MVNRAQFYSFLYSRKGAELIFWIACVGHVLMTLVFFDHTDYAAYQAFWSDFLSYGTVQVYPIGFFIFFAPLWKIWHHLPKMVFLACFLLENYQLLHILYTHPDFRDVSGSRKFWGVMVILLSPVFATEPWTGLFDPVIGLLVLNTCLLFARRSGNQVVRSIVLAILVILVILVKFVGIVLILPFLYDAANFQRDDGPRKSFFSRARPFIVRAGILIVLGAGGFFLLLLFDKSILNIISPFIVNYQRSYVTFFYILHLNGEPFFLTLFQAGYSATGVYIFFGSLAILYICLYKKRASPEAWILLPIFAFLTFFPASHVQFVQWILPVFSLYYLKHAPKDPHVTKKFILLQAIAIGVNFYVPFMQFFYLYFILDIFDIESHRNLLLVNPDSHC
jgi:hypothetical protein